MLRGSDSFSAQSWLVQRVHEVLGTDAASDSILLLASDGVWDVLRVEELAAMLPQRRAGGARVGLDFEWCASWSGALWSGGRGVRGRLG